MFELTINDNEYKFNFGFGFMKDTNKRHKEQAQKLLGDNARKNSGVWIALSNVFYDDDVEELVALLIDANKGFEPRISEKILTEYLDDDTNDIEEMLDTVKKSLLKSNSCKKEMKRVQEMLDQRAKEEAAEKAAEAAV